MRSYRVLMMTKKTTVTETELKLLTLHAAGRGIRAICSHTGLSHNDAIVMSYELRKRLGMGPLASLREWARANLNTLTIGVAS
jgi:hypothetical protein